METLDRSLVVMGLGVSSTPSQKKATSARDLGNSETSPAVGARRSEMKEDLNFEDHKRIQKKAGHYYRGNGRRNNTDGRNRGNMMDASSVG